ncbi:MAG: GGDEF domain-containing protein [candidate division WOR-3 bacterium]|nr:MAG: GGDEF domain-containing protein [candidate division WOR-3 bacterium]
MVHLFDDVTTYLSRKSQKSLSVLSVVLVPILGCIDYLTGHEISFSIFYLFPVALMAWFVGKWRAFSVGLLSAITWFVADRAAGHVYIHPIMAFWNTSMRLGFFLIMAYLLSILKTRFEYEKQLSREDSLTGVANTRAFYEYLNQETQRAQRYIHPFSLAYIDLDNFKSINDERGHTVGDELLMSIARSLKANIRGIDMVARLGGDEFALLFPEIDGEASKATMKRLQNCLLKEMKAAGYAITMSIGVVTITKTPISAQEVIKKADDLMYEAKKAGRNTIRYEVL